MSHCDNWSAYGERKGQWGLFCKTESSSLWSPAWILTLVITCRSAIVTQMSGVKCSCVLGQKVDLLFNQGEAQPREILQMHYCNGIPSDLLPGSPDDCKEINVHGSRGVSWEPGVTIQSDSKTCCGHCQLLPPVHRVASGIFLNQKQERVVSQLVADIRHQTAFRKKRNPCCQKVCRLIAQICPRGLLISNAIVSFQQNWHNSKRFSSSQTGFATSLNQPQFLPSFLNTRFCLFLSIYFKQYSRWGQHKQNENRQSKCQIKPEHGHMNKFAFPKDMCNKINTKQKSAGTFYQG